MDDYLKQAIELVKAQSSVRVMQEEEMVTMIRTLAASLKNLENNQLPENDEEELSLPAPSKSIGKKASPASNAANPSNSLPEKHLARHGLDADSYRRKWGIKSDTPLVCKSIQRVRRKKMKDMRLWEKDTPLPKRKEERGRRDTAGEEGNPFEKGLSLFSVSRRTRRPVCARYAVRPAPLARRRAAL